MVEAEATKPNKSVGVPRLEAKGFRTGVLLDIVELNIAKNPSTQSVKNALSLVFLGSEIIQ
jgi:hypothetical protein